MWHAVTRPYIKTASLLALAQGHTACYTPTNVHAFATPALKHARTRAHVRRRLCVCLCCASACLCVFEYVCVCVLRARLCVCAFARACACERPAQQAREKTSAETPGSKWGDKGLTEPDHLVSAREETSGLDHPVIHVRMIPDWGLPCDWLMW